MKYGFTWSSKYCEQLGVSSSESLANLLSRRSWDVVRLPIYWDRVESEPGVWNFDEVWEHIDVLVAQGVDIMPVVGYRNPRWPERHGPDWLQDMSPQEFESVLLRYVERCVREVQDVSNITAWQVENEPFDNHWGDPGFDVRTIYIKELELVRSLDTRPCLVSYGFQVWKDNFSHNSFPEDIVGLDLYTKIGQSWKGVALYPDVFITPFSGTRLRHAVNLIRNNNRPVWVTELQAEPWDCVDGALENPKQWHKTISPARLKRNIRYASQAGVSTIIIWGVEWWYTLDPSDREDFLDQI